MAYTLREIFEDLRTIFKLYAIIIKIRNALNILVYLT